MTEQLMPIKWENQRLLLLDQTVLPNEVIYREYNTIEGVWDAIRNMVVRGAPAIGVSAGYGLYLGAKEISEETFASFWRRFKEMSDYLKTTRPTAVNLFWSLQRLENLVYENKEKQIEEIKELIFKEAVSIHKEDEDINKRIGENLLDLLHDGDGILTHCNAGVLATTKYGTATSPIYLGKEKGINFKVFADETRPRLQGAALTSFELSQADVDVTVITDNMAALVMSQNKIDAVIVGADRVAANGDVANKIGTLNVSILAKYYNIPFYVASPSPTIDVETPTGEEIPIEERDTEEVTNRFGVRTVPKDVNVYNPGFDVTPHNNIDAIITEQGVIYPPFAENILKI